MVIRNQTENQPGIGTNEKALIEVMSSRTNEEIAALKEVYKTKYGKELVDDLQSDTSGYFGRLLFSLAQGINEKKATEIDSDKDYLVYH